MNCDSCMYVQEYGPRTAEIIEKAIVVAGLLDRIPAGKWEDEEEGLNWARRAGEALDELDGSIGILTLRLKARHPRV